MAYGIVDYLRMIFRRVNKIDGDAVDGLLGTNNSLAYKVHEIEKHFHGLERWYGNDGDSTGSTANNHAEWTLAAAGSANTYGTEVLMLAANDVKAADFDVTPVKFDLHELFIYSIDTVDKMYVIQIYSGTGAFGDSTLRVECPVMKETVKSQPVPIEVMCPRITVAEKIWGRVKCETASAELTLTIGLHAYAG